MGCGNITPSNSIRIQKNAIFHEIRIQKIDKLDKSNSKLKNQNSSHRFKKVLSKKSFESQENGKNKENKKFSLQNTKTKLKNILKKNTSSNQDLSIKRKRNVKFKQIQPRFSLRVQNIDRLEDRIQIDNNINFDKQKSGKQKIHKKPRHLLNRINTDKQEYLPSINSSMRPTVFNDKNFLTEQFQKVKPYNLAQNSFPRMKVVKTENNESFEKQQRKTVDYKKYLKLLKQKSSIQNIIGNHMTQNHNFTRNQNHYNSCHNQKIYVQNERMAAPFYKNQKINSFQSKDYTFDNRQEYKKPIPKELQKENVINKRKTWVQKTIYF